MELVSIILNFLLASGLAGTLLFFNSKRRRESAAADSVELENTEKVVARVIAAAGTGGVVVTEIATVIAIKAATIRRRHSAF